MAVGFRNPPIVPALAAGADVTQAGMTSLLTPWVGGRAGAPAAVATQAGMTSMIAPWMGGRVGAVPVTPPPPPPRPSNRSRAGGAGGGAWWYPDRDLAARLQQVWDRERAKKAAESASSDKKTATEEDAPPKPTEKIVFKHYWWETEKEKIVEKVVEKIVERWNTIVLDTTPLQKVLIAIGAFAAGALAYKAATTWSRKRPRSLKRRSVGRFAARSAGKASWKNGKRPILPAKKRRKKPRKSRRRAIAVRRRSR